MAIRLPGHILHRGLPLRSNHQNGMGLPLEIWGIGGRTGRSLMFIDIDSLGRREKSWKVCRFAGLKVCSIDRLSPQRLSEE